MLTESREEFSDLYSIFRLRALRYILSKDKLDYSTNNVREVLGRQKLDF